MLIKFSTAKTVPEVVVALTLAVPSHRFNIIQVHDIQEQMKNHGVEFARQCMVFEVGQIQQDGKASEQSASIFTALPCRIFVYAEDDRTVVATLNPTVLLAAMFDAPQLPKADQEIEDSIIAIMKQATGG
jgi:uncharacterized protein (DUF302 family)